MCAGNSRAYFTLFVPLAVTSSAAIPYTGQVSRFELAGRSNNFKGAHMKAITRSKIYGPMAAIILIAALGIPAAAQKQVPFKGTIQGQDTDKGFTSPGMFLVESNGTGNGILLGRFTFILETTINVAELTDTGVAHFKSANGDTLDATFTSVMPAQQ